MNKRKSILLFTSLFLTHHIAANEVETFEEIEVYGIYEAYECNIDNIYSTGSGRSTDKRGGTLVVTISNENVDIKSNRGDVNSGSLTLVVRSEQEIIAINKSMRFTYGVNSNKFSFETGNGQSKFRGGVGHVGEQVMTSGSCTES